MVTEVSNLTPGRVMLLDDHELFGQSLAMLISKMLPGTEISYYKNTVDSLSELKKNDYRFLLTDLVLAGHGMEDFIKYCKRAFPSLRIIVISAVVDLRAVKKFMDFGVDAYLSKATNSYELGIAFQKIDAGKKFISSDLSTELLSSQHIVKSEFLTQKELEVLQSIAAGNNVRRTAELMLISPYTVMAHRRNIMKKLQLHSAAELVGYAYKNKLTEY